MKSKVFRLRYNKIRLFDIRHCDMGASIIFDEPVTIEEAREALLQHHIYPVEEGATDLAPCITDPMIEDLEIINEDE